MLHNIFIKCCKKWAQTREATTDGDKLGAGIVHDRQHVHLFCTFLKPLVSYSNSGWTAGLWSSRGGRGGLQALCKRVIPQLAPYPNGYADASSTDRVALSKRSPSCPSALRFIT